MRRSLTSRLPEPGRGSGIRYGVGGRMTGHRRTSPFGRGRAGAPTPPRLSPRRFLTRRWRHQRAREPRAALRPLPPRRLVGLPKAPRLPVGRAAFGDTTAFRLPEGAGASGSGGRLAAEALFGSRPSARLKVIVHRTKGLGERDAPTSEAIRPPVGLRQQPPCDLTTAAGCAPSGLRVVAVPHSCPKRLEAHPLNHAGRDLRTSRDPAWMLAFVVDRRH